VSEIPTHANSANPYAVNEVSTWRQASTTGDSQIFGTFDLLEAGQIKIPEPGTLGLLITGLLGFGLTRRRRVA